MNWNYKTTSFHISLSQFSWYRSLSICASSYCSRK